MSKLGQSLNQYLELSGKTADMKLSEMGIRSPDDVVDITMEVNVRLSGSTLVTNKDVWNIMTKEGLTDPSLNTAMTILTEAIELWEGIHT